MTFETYIKRQIAAERHGIERKARSLKGKEGKAFLNGYLNALEALERKVKEYDGRNHDARQIAMF